jgi:IstB-like ATP binding protein
MNAEPSHPRPAQGVEPADLDGMADAFIELQSQAQAAELAHAEWLALLLDRKSANRNTRRFQVRLRNAKLRHVQAVIEDVDYRAPRRLDKALFQQLAAGKWLAEHRNHLVTGPCGVGKSWLSCALAQKACRDGLVFYARVPRLFADLEVCALAIRDRNWLRGSTPCQMQILTTWKFHGALLCKGRFQALLRRPSATNPIALICGLLARGGHQRCH